MKPTAILIAIFLCGCATHSEWSAPGILASSPDNPDVKVASDVEVIKLTPLGMQPPIDIRPDPGLALSFKRAMERYVRTGQFRIISAELTMSTALTRQHVTLTMMIEYNGRTHQIRHDWHTEEAGWGNKPLKLIPEYLDAIAKKFTDKIRFD